MSEKASTHVNWLGLATIWFGGMVSVPALLIGSTLIAGLPFYDALLAAFIGCTIVATFMSLEGVAAVRERRDTVSLASSSFGRTGGKTVVGVALGVALLGWFGVQSGVAGASFSKIMNVSFGVHVPTPLASMGLGILMMLTAVFGFQHLKWLNFIAVPCKIMLVGYAVIVAFQGTGFEVITQYQPPADRRIDFYTAVGLSIGFFSVGGVIAPDYARHARTRRDAVLGAVLGLIPAALGLAACGAMLAIIQQTYDIVEIYAKLGMPVLALSVLIIATWSTNVMNAYSSGLAITQLLHWPQERRQLATVIAGVLGCLLAASGILQHFTSFLMLLTITVPPVAGVLVCDYWIARSYTSSEQQSWKFDGIFAWGAGVAVMLGLTHPLKNVLGIVVAGVVYFMLARRRVARLEGAAS